MKIISFNVRGLGSSGKIRVIREMLAREKVDMVCLQETKLVVVDQRLCSQVWGDYSCEWRAIAATNGGGGLLCVWNAMAFNLVQCVEGSRDFNAVRYAEERVGVMSGFVTYAREMEEFNRFILDMEVMDIPLQGRRFTWFRPNGQARSRLDRFLVSNTWLEWWPNCSQLVMDRDISDHCPILLRRVFQDWGPKSFRVLNYWLEDARLPVFVENVWSNLQVHGWSSGLVLKEKLKRLRLALKQWNFEVFGDLRTKRHEVVCKISELDKKEEEVGLSTVELGARQQLISDFWGVLKHHESLLCQKARSKWVKEGDRNSKFFHSSIKWRRKTNSIVGIMVDGSWEEDPARVKVEAKRFFEAKFSSTQRACPTLDGVPFRVLNSVDNALLTAVFEKA
ncbi:uncharacterized protein LOC130745452 [Lotus japonicus]|uniref:uncharacterized protein LOC130745452 n=1 Tax=Lotus japonicus TaxID=34305 RepID=UPI00258E8079|nr:uncharacterized protein LOC130745452 [Lotus japonicus]